MAWGRVSTSTRFDAVAIVADAAKSPLNAAAPVRKRDEPGGEAILEAPVAMPLAIGADLAAEPTSADSTMPVAATLEAAAARRPRASAV